MDHNQIKYSQHRLSLYQQRFNFSSTILLEAPLNCESPFLPCPRRVFSLLTLLALGLPEPAGYRSDGWKRQRTTYFPFLVLPSVALAPSWDPHGVSLTQVCTGGCLTAAVLGKSSCKDGASFHWKLSSLPTSKCQHRNRGRSGGHTYTKNVNPFSQASLQNKRQPWLP